LTADTIITAFPRRWPRHKHDYTGVQQSIKIRLRNSPKGEIRTVYDLALLIINQASKVFHDRTITADRQPPVMDHFANAIGNLVSSYDLRKSQFNAHQLQNNKQTIAYDHLWNCARALANMKRNKNDRRAAALEKYMLDINSEGELLKEIDEIKDELRMMIFFKERQQHVLEEFEVHVGNILHQSLERLNREQRHLRALAKKAKEAKFDSELVEKKDLKDKSDISPGVKSKGKKKIVWTITPEKEAWTKSMIKDRTKSLQGQHAELSGLYRSAEQTEQAVRICLILSFQTSYERLLSDNQRYNICFS
jgi:HD superfamily phosphohydrolase